MVRNTRLPNMMASAEFRAGVEAGREEVRCIASRRGFLRRSAGLSMAAASAALLAGQRAEAREQFPELYPHSNVMYFNEIKADESAHVQFFLDVLGSAARPTPTFQNLHTTSLFNFGAVSVVIENVAVHAYLGALTSISNRSFLGGVATIATVEARHAAYINALGDQALVPYGVAFDFPLSQQQVLTAASPYIASLNGGPPLAFDTVNLSLANDAAIANFALALEYLAQSFYDMNVPIYF